MQDSLSKQERLYRRFESKLSGDDYAAIEGEPVKTLTELGERGRFSRYAFRPIDTSKYLLNQGTFERAALGMVIGPYGIGKSGWLMQMLEGVSRGASTLGFTPVKPLNCLLVQSEDTPNTLVKISASITNHLGP